MIWFAFFDEEEEPQMYDLLQLFELGPSVNREEKRKIKIFVVPPYAVICSFKPDSAWYHIITQHYIKLLFFFENEYLFFMSFYEEVIQKGTEKSVIKYHEIYILNSILYSLISLY